MEAVAGFAGIFVGDLDVVAVDVPVVVGDSEVVLGSSVQSSEEGLGSVAEVVEVDLGISLVGVAAEIALGERGN